MHAYTCVIICTCTLANWLEKLPASFLPSSNLNAAGPGAKSSIWLYSLCLCSVILNFLNRKFINSRHYIILITLASVRNLENLKTFSLPI
jgi:hypothetical protein